MSEDPVTVVLPFQVVSSPVLKMVLLRPVTLMFVPSTVLLKPLTTLPEPKIVFPSVSLEYDVPRTFTPLTMLYGDGGNGGDGEEGGEGGAGRGG